MEKAVLIAGTFMTAKKEASSYQLKIGKETPLRTPKYGHEPQAIFSVAGRFW
jgi:hypothetical protein